MSSKDLYYTMHAGEYDVNGPFKTEDEARAALETYNRDGARVLKVISTCVDVVSHNYKWTAV